MGFGFLAVLYPARFASVTDLGGLMKHHGLPSVGGGAATSAWLRWCFGTALNPIIPAIPLGMLGIPIVRSLFSVEAP